MHEILAVAHGSDLDGIACHAILNRYAHLKGIKITHFFVDYENFGETIRKVNVIAQARPRQKAVMHSHLPCDSKSVSLTHQLRYCGKVQDSRTSSARHAEIAIADIGYNEKILESVETLRKLSRSGRLKWFDHHTWPKKHPFTFVKFMVGKKTCGAKLVLRHYLPKDSTARRLAELAYYSDFKVGNERVLKFQDVIASGYSRSKLTKLLSAGVLWNRELEKRYREYQSVKQRAYKYLDAHSKYYEVGKWHCVVGLSSDKLSSAVSTEHLLKEHADFVICLWKSGKMSSRKNNPKVDIEKIARIFNGGGREIASGGSLGRRVNEKNYLKIFDEVIEKIRELNAG